MTHKLYATHTQNTHDKCRNAHNKFMKNALEKHKRDAQTTHEAHAQNTHKKIINTHNMLATKYWKIPPQKKRHEHTASS